MSNEIFEYVKGVQTTIHQLADLEGYSVLKLLQPGTFSVDILSDDDDNILYLILVSKLHAYIIEAPNFEQLQDLKEVFTCRSSPFNVACSKNDYALLIKKLLVTCTPRFTSDFVPTESTDLSETEFVKIKCKYLQFNEVIGENAQLCEAAWCAQLLCETIDMEIKQINELKNEKEFEVQKAEQALKLNINANSESKDEIKKEEQVNSEKKDNQPHEKDEITEKNIPIECADAELQKVKTREDNAHKSHPENPVKTDQQPASISDKNLNKQQQSENLDQIQIDVLPEEPKPDNIQIVFDPSQSENESNKPKHIINKQQLSEKNLRKQEGRQKIKERMEREERERKIEQQKKIEQEKKREQEKKIEQEKKEKEEKKGNEKDQEINIKFDEAVLKDEKKGEKKEDKQRKEDKKKEEKKDKKNDEKKKNENKKDDEIKITVLPKETEKIEIEIEQTDKPKNSTKIPEKHQNKDQISIIFEDDKPIQQNKNEKIEEKIDIKFESTESSKAESEIVIYVEPIEKKKNKIVDKKDSEKQKKPDDKKKKFDDKKNRK